MPNPNPTAVNALPERPRPSAEAEKLAQAVKRLVEAADSTELAGRLDVLLRCLPRQQDGECMFAALTGISLGALRARLQARADANSAA